LKSRRDREGVWAIRGFCRPGMTRWSRGPARTLRRRCRRRGWGN